jgi:hypothetical protein
MLHEEPGVIYPRQAPELQVDLRNNQLEGPKSAFQNVLPVFEIFLWYLPCSY